MKQDYHSGRAWQAGPKDKRMVSKKQKRWRRLLVLAIICLLVAFYLLHRFQQKLPQSAQSVQKPKTVKIALDLPKQKQHQPTLATA